MKTVYKALSVIVGLSVFVAAVLAHFLRSVDIENQIIYDGLGRVLTEPPAWAKMFFTSDYEWAGLGWLIADAVWFFGGFGLAIWLYSLGSE